MSLMEIKVGDVVRVEDDPSPWRVEAKNEQTGMLTLEALHAMNPVTWTGVHEFRVEKRGVFA